MTTYILKSLDDIPALTDTAGTVGSYDGVHLGHRAMIARLRDEARARALSPVLITFHPHHRIFFRREHGPFLLTALDEKLELLETTGVEAVLVLPFAERLASMRAEQFVREMLREQLGCRLFLVGHDQAIGADQLRGVTDIRAVARRVGVEVASVTPVREDRVSVSSTWIRRLLRTGDVRTASRLLGYHYFLTGEVVYGERRGRTLGYPTANLSIKEAFKLIPADGVYAATAETPGGTLRGMLYIGRRPTFGDGPRMVEVFLLDWRADLYGRSVRVHLLERLRGDMTFRSSDELAEQIRLDESHTRELFRRREENPMSALDKAMPSP